MTKKYRYINTCRDFRVIQLSNARAYTHYSYAIRDALASITVPKVEIHISNIMEREDFRKVSVTAPACDKQIYGQGLEGYLTAIDFVLGKTSEC